MLRAAVPRPEHGAVAAGRGGFSLLELLVVLLILAMAGTAVVATLPGAERSPTEPVLSDLRAVYTAARAAAASRGTSVRVAVHLAGGA
jgi:prepilin-type N-terminal cleavage/methylation domain-containing protein